MAELTIAAGIARGLLNFAVSRGADREALAERSGIVLADLADQDNRVPLTKYIALMRAAQALCGDPALALHYAEKIDFGEISIVAGSMLLKRPPPVPAPGTAPTLLLPWPGHDAQRDLVAHPLVDGDEDDAAELARRQAPQLRPCRPRRRPTRASSRSASASSPAAAAR